MMNELEATTTRSEVTTIVMGRAATRFSQQLVKDVKESRSITNGMAVWPMNAVFYFHSHGHARPSCEVIGIQLPLS
jgi:hypothetical protein